MKSPSIPYELRVGVTGHRHLPDPEGVTEAIDNLLNHIQFTCEHATEFPNGKCGSTRSWGDKIDLWLSRCVKVVWRSLPVSPEQISVESQTPLEWIVVSSLASGADRRVAEAVLSRPGAILEALLPFPVEEYSKDFTEPEDLQEFQSFLNSDQTRVVTLINDPQVSENQDVRNRGYLTAGKRVVNDCEILITVWDGKAARGTGGTAEVVQYALERNKIVLWIHSEQPAAAPLLITDQQSDHAQAGPLPGSWLAPIPATAKQLSLNFHQLSSYNRDAACNTSKCRQIRTELQHELLADTTKVNLSPVAFASVMEPQLSYYARADQLAIRYQSLYVTGAVGLYSLSAFAVTIAVVQVMYFPHQLWLILFEILAMLLAVLLLRISRKHAWHEKWLHDRHLAERIRISCFTSLLPSVKSSNAESTEYDRTNPLSFYSGPPNWVELAHQKILKQIHSISESDIEFPVLKQFLIHHWLQNQIDWHLKNARKKKRVLHWVHRSGLILFLTTMVMAVIHMSGIGHHVEGTPPSAWGLIAPLSTTLAIILPAWGAATHAINLLRERERVASRSEEMANALARIALQMEKVADFKELFTCVELAESVMSTENLEWCISLQFRGLELPA
ncbi:hypothetical protein [Gimesia algae]|uniref:SMODS and SLOG-associating 2TM effector domain-containing protein n=1 Tax=Gimesia algae TaxID=2527971 RepID=A0A517VA96_9PLAN|nr:hypothetical protein [Gimesia algae]QDT89934.1 hypothetical protein Pan161_15670 [Gimesia algae]